MTTPTVTANWLNANLTDPNLVILDASPTSNVSGLKSELDGIRIPGARYFDLKKRFSDLNAEMPNTLPTAEAFERECQKLGINSTDKIVVYDNLGIYTSPRVWWMFLAMGHQQIAVLDGGLPEWKSQGFETETIKENLFPKGNFHSKPNRNLLTKMEEVVDNLDTKTAIVIDARSEGRFLGSAPEPRAGLKSGKIPGSKNLPFGKVLENGKLKSTDELRAIFDDLKLETRPIVFSCGSGLTACIILLAAELVSENPKSVYDGSWTEWTQKQNM